MTDFVAVTFQFEGDIEFEMAFFLPTEEWEYTRQQMLDDDEGLFPIQLEFGGYSLGNYEDAQELFDLGNVVVTKLTETEYNTMAKVFPNYRVGPAEVELPYMAI